MNNNDKIIIGLLIAVFIVLIITRSGNNLSVHDMRTGQVLVDYEMSNEFTARENYVMALKHMIRCVEIAPTWRDGLNGMGGVCFDLGEKQTSQFFLLLYQSATEPNDIELQQITNCLNMLKVKYELD